MRTKVLAFFLFAAAALAQRPIPVPIFPPDLRKFLDLTDQQVQAISRANVEYLQYATQKFVRMGEVQREIAEETRKEVLDPGALGIRYAEIEAIRRDLDDRQKRLREQIAAQLTDPQKAKVKVLDEARRMQPLIRDAECTNILAPLPFGNVLPVIRLAPIADFEPAIGCFSFAGPLAP